MTNTDLAFLPFPEEKVRLRGVTISVIGILVIIWLLVLGAWNLELDSQILSYQNHDHIDARRFFCQGDIDIADSIRRFAIRAHPCLCTGGLPTEPSGILGSGPFLHLLLCGFHILYNLIHSADDDRLFWADEHGAHPVARGIDIEQFSVLGHRIRA